jgi:hypothetical protein
MPPIEDPEALTAIIALDQRDKCGDEGVHARMRMDEHERDGILVEISGPRQLGIPVPFLSQRYEHLPISRWGLHLQPVSSCGRHPELSVYSICTLVARTVLPAVGELHPDRPGTRLECHGVQTVECTEG